MAAGRALRRRQADRRFDEAGADLRKALRLFVDLGDDGGATTASGFLAALAGCGRNRAGVLHHAEQRLSVRAADRYVCSYLDVVTAIVAATRDAGYDATHLESRRAGHAAVLRDEGDADAAGKLLDDVPTLLAAMLDAPAGAVP